jgi:hypothetical protein
LTGQAKCVYRGAAMRPREPDRLRLVNVALFATILAMLGLSDLCDPWGLCPSERVQEFVRLSVVLAGVGAIAAFGLGVPAVGLALCGTLIGGTFGEPLGGFWLGRGPFGAALGASIGTCCGGLLGIVFWPIPASGSRRFSILLLLAASATLSAGLVAASLVPEMIRAADRACREPRFGQLCHRDFIGWLMAVDAAFLTLLIGLAARRRRRTLRALPAYQRILVPSAWEPSRHPTAS